MFDGKIELWEWTYSPRNSVSSVWSRIWGTGCPLPSLRNQVEFKDLEQEFRSLLRHFIIEYQWANPPSQPSKQK